MKFMSSMSLASLALVAAACGGGKDDPKVPLIDAPPQQMDAPAVQCTGPATSTALTNPFLGYLADRDTMTTGHQERWSFIGDLNADVKPDWFWIDLYEGTPPGFSTLNFPATPFTVELAGAELSFATCSTCVSLTTDVDLEATTQDELVYEHDFFATGGSITFTTLTATNMAGTLNNVTFAHVDYDDEGTPVPNASGCTSTIPSATFEGMVMANARGDGRKGLAVRARIKK